MHSSDAPPAPPATGPSLLLQLGRLIVRARSVGPAAPHDRLLQAKLLAVKPSTSQVQSQPKPDNEEPRPGLEAQLSNHVHALWNEHIPVCIEVLLAPDCPECYTSLVRVDEDFSYDRLHSHQRALLLERWTMRSIINKNHESPLFMTSQWLLNAVRSQLHFSQLAAWLARLRAAPRTDTDPTERRRKLSRETCNYKKLEANCDQNELQNNEEPTQRKLNIVYSIKIPGESYKMAEFVRPPNDHTFPVTDIGNNVYLKVILESLPRIDEIPTVKCYCQSKRRASKELSVSAHEELAGKLNDLTIGPPRTSKFSDASAMNSNLSTASRRLSIISNTGQSYSQTDTETKDSKLLDDRMLTPCSESGKHKCNCDDESDGKENHRSSTSLSPQEHKKLDDRRLKEIAKCKRRLRKESKLRKFYDSTSSEGDGMQKTKETHTSIPILQAARFDRFRAIGCYRNQTYLTLPASRMEIKSPFTETVSMSPAEFKRTNTVGTQTEDVLCQCGSPLRMKCDNCLERGMVRSEANYDLASLNRPESSELNRSSDENGARRKREDDVQSFKKHKCDKSSVNLKCDISGVVDSFSSVSSDSIEDRGIQKNQEDDNSLIKRPKLKRFFPRVDRIEKLVIDRSMSKYVESKDILDLHLKVDDTVFSRPKKEKRQKTFSISEDDYILYEKCDYGTFDRCEVESPKEVLDQNGFRFPEPRKGQDSQIPSPTEMDNFRWRFDSAASMVFHNKTGLPLTSSPAPLRRRNNCFGFDDTINGISGIKSALFHPVSPPSPGAAPASPPPPRPVPAPPLPAAPPPNKEPKTPKLRIGPSAGLLGSFEESALKGRLEPVATVHGFTAELGASGAICPAHKRLPVTVFFYAPGGTNAPYMGHINLGPEGYRVSRSGTIQVSLFNPHGTLVKMFVVLYDLTAMPPMAKTFLRQRTLYMPAGAEPPAPHHMHKWLRYLIHLRFMTSKSGKLYLHTDIRIIVSRKADLDTATAHSAIFRPLPTNHGKDTPPTTNQGTDQSDTTNRSVDFITNDSISLNTSTNRAPNRFFGGCSEFNGVFKRDGMTAIGYENQNGVSYELRSFTYAPENPKFSPR